MRSSKASGVSPRHSISRAAARGSAPFMSGTRPNIASSRSHCVREGRSNISTASTAVWSRRTLAAEQAEWTSGNMTKADALCGHSGTVLYVARDTKPNVPSDPIMRRLTISTGRSAGKSTSALRE